MIGTSNSRQSISADDDRVKELTRAIADAVEASRDDGMGLNEALSLIAIIVTEYGRIAFGDNYVEHLCETIRG